MILCINANAAIDKTVIVPGFHLNAIFRPQQVMAFPGGKGINAARGVKTLGGDPLVTGWVGGDAGKFIERGLHGEGIQTDFIHCDFESRTCLSILDPENGSLTEIYEKGESVPTRQIEAFRSRFRANLHRFQAVTFSGSLPPGVPSTFYAEMLQAARQAGVPAMLDSSGEPLRQGLELGRPTLVKPNLLEFQSLIGRDLSGLEEYARAAQETACLYDTLVVLSLGAEGAIAANAKSVALVRPPDITIRSAVGSGDCLLAGVTLGLVRGLSVPDALRQGVAAGTANALTVGAGHFNREDFERVLAGCETLML